MPSGAEVAVSPCAAVRPSRPVSSNTTTARRIVLLRIIAPGRAGTRIVSLRIASVSGTTKLFSGVS